MVKPGDMVYIRQGTYYENVRIETGGDSNRPITFQAYPGESPVIDGNNQLPTSFTGLVAINASWINISGLEIRNSRYMGVALIGTHITVSKLYVHHSQRNGILIMGDYGTVLNSEIWRNSLFNEYNKAGSNDTGLSAARDIVNGITDHAVIQGNLVWENWGEGISSYEANGTIIKNNISHDNLTTNIYISDSTNVLCDGNFVYRDPASITSSYSNLIGIMMGDENYSPASAHIKVINNIGYGNDQNFFWWQGSHGGGMNDVLIANNTFVNASGTRIGSGNVTIGTGSHVNSYFMNNIVTQSGSFPVIATIAQSGITYSYNLWSKIPYSAASGTGDIVGDPQFVMTGSPYSSGWYKLKSTSSAIGKAYPLPAVTVDYLNNPRDSKPDMGALEYIP